MKHLSLKSGIFSAVFAAIILTGIYINLIILMNQTFYQIFEGDLGLSFNTFMVFMIVLLFLAGLQYLIRQDATNMTKNEQYLEECS